MMISGSEIRFSERNSLLRLICIALSLNVAIASGDGEDQLISTKTSLEANHNKDEQEDDAAPSVPCSRSFSDLSLNNQVDIALNLDTYVYQALQHIDHESAAVVAMARALSRAGHQQKIQAEYGQLMEVTNVPAELLLDRFTWCPLTLDNNEDHMISWPSLRRLMLQMRGKTSKLWRGSFTGDDSSSYLVVADDTAWQALIHRLFRFTNGQLVGECCLDCAQVHILCQSWDLPPARQITSLKKIESLLKNVMAGV